MDRRYGSKIVDKACDMTGSQKEKIVEELEFITALAKVKKLKKDALDELIRNIWEGNYE